MKKSFILTFAVLVCSIAFLRADDPKIKLTFGPEYELTKKHYPIAFVGDLNKGFVQIGYAYQKSVSLQKFSPTLKLQSEKIVDLKSMPKGFAFRQIVTWGSKYYWFFDVYDKKAEREHLFAQEIDLEKGELKGTAKELLQCKRIGSYYKWDISFSSDSNKMFLYVKFPNESRDDSKNYQEYGCWVFDKDMKSIWAEPSIKMPYTEKKMEVEDLQGDRDGNLLILARVFNDDTKKEIKDNAPNFHFEILKFSAGVKKPTSVPFKFEDKYVAQVTLLEDLDGKIVCTGFYANQDKNGKLKANSGKLDGSFFLRLDSKENKLVNVHKGFYEIPGEVFKMYEADKAQKKMDKKEEKGEDMSGYNMRLRKVIFGEDGSLLVVGEEYYTRTVTYTSGNRMVTRTYYHYNDVIAQYIDGSGNLSWTKKIPKKQTGVDTRLNLGFRILPCNGANYLFFFDNPKNLNPNPGDDVYPFGAGWGGVLMAVRLDKSGEMKKTKVFDVRESKDKVDFMDASRIGSNSLITIASEGVNPFTLMPKGASKICLVTVQ